MRVTVGLITGWLKCKPTGEDPNREVTGISTDTRTLKPGDCFVALRGPNFDGHAFVAEAFARGAALAVVDQADALGGRLGFVVRDARAALGEMAHCFRWTAPLIPWIAVTGSNGKTTTRSLLAHMLRHRGPVACPEANYNNEIGLPLTILGKPDDAWAGVLEMGTSHPGEIANLTRIAVPTISILTGIGPAHLEGLGTIENVAREKGSIFDRLPQDGLGIFPLQCPFAPQIAERIRTAKASFGIGMPCDWRAEEVRLDARGSSFRVRGIEVRLHLLGEHNILNALAAFAAAARLGIPLADAVAACSSFCPVPDRLHPVATQHLLILSDVYNANPGSLCAAAAALEAVDAPRRVAIIGDMLELGAASAELHREAGRNLSRRRIDLILAAGKETVALAEAAAGSNARAIVRHYPTVKALCLDAGKILQPGDAVLVKGSRGMRMESVVTALKAWTPGGAKTGVWRKNG